MGLSCGMSVVKYGIFTFNLICVIAGIALIVAGAIPLTQLDEIRAVFPEDNPAVIPILIIVLGSLIFFISFLGCCGAIKESYCMVLSYSIFLTLMVIGQIAISIYIFVSAKEFAETAVKGFNLIWDQMMIGNEVGRVAVNGIQSALTCCGRRGPTDWNSMVLPSSCCDFDATTCSVLNAFPVGCSSMLFDSILGSGLLMAWISISFGVILTVGVFFSCCLANSIRKVNRRTM